MMRIDKKNKVAILNAALKKQLAEKVREFKIETGLEKVRAVALKMKEPADMLKVCRRISLQLQWLGVKDIRNVQTAIFYESRGTYMNYEYYAKHQKTIITETSYTNHKVHKAFAKKMLQGKGESYSTHIKGKKVKDWITYQKTTNVFIDKYLDTASSLNYYWHSLGPVAIGLSTYVPLRKDDLNLFNRFRKVFELAYTRYLDIEQAIAQAKEAKIEASLEKVRAQALSMRKAEDLPLVCEALFKELQALGFTGLRNAMVNIHNDEKRTFVNYDYSDEIGKSITPLFYDIHPVIKKQIKTIRSADDAFSETVFKGKDLESWKAFRKSRGEKADKRIKNSTALYYYFYSIGTGSIGISTFGAIHEEKKVLLRRFRNVFALSYQRYTDIALAEAQAKEARIETALERVRAGAMAMHKMNDLSAIGKTIFLELKSLGFTGIRNTEMVINNDKKETVSSYHYSDYGREEVLEINYKANPIVKKWASDLRKAPDAFVPVSIPEKQMKPWMKYRKEIGYKPDPKMAKAKTVHYYSYSTGLGALSISTWQTLIEEQIIILERFRNVFKLSYQRYVDIAKAEKQAREAEIELGLERVRARAMAMQHSDELAELVATVFRELNKLDFSLASCIIWIHSPSEKSNALWIASEEMNNPARPLQIVPFYPPFFTSIIAAWKLKDPKWIFSLTGAEKRKFQKLFFKQYPELPNALRNPVRENKQIFFSASFSSFGALEVVANAPLSGEKFEILHRFGNVFNTSYTRFNDLQKAEAQAREAEIQLALERVRARTMAMQKSEELRQVVSVLFAQMKSLGFEAFMSAIILNHKERKEYDCLMSSDVQSELPDIYRVPYFENHFMKVFTGAFNEGVAYKVLELSGKDKQDYDHNLFTNTDFKKLPDETKKMMLSVKSCQLCCAYMSYGCIEAIGAEPLSENDALILQRFAKVFEQTYTRFLDLKKAEAQAREAEIELALERIRAKTMAMHQSDELLETGSILFSEMQKLGIESLTAGYVLMDKEGNNGLNYAPDPATKKIMPLPVIIPHNETIDMQQVVANWKKGKPYFIVELDEHETIKHQTFIAERSTHFPLNAAQLIAISPSKLFLHNFYFNEGYVLIVGGSRLSAEQTDIMLRFTKLFQQTYTRFLDLQKAEAQAREAEIQLALERVRARSLAMHHTDELQEVVNVVAQQLLQMGIDMDGGIFIAINNEVTNDLPFWAAAGATDYVQKVTIPFFNRPIYTHLCNAIKQRESFITEYYSKAEKNEFLKHMFRHHPWNQNSAKRKAELLARDGGYARSVSVNHYTTIGITNHHGKKFTDAENEILRRFAYVLEQSYTRFLDLQKAEAQAREAQIEVALERVRTVAMGMHKQDDLMEICKVVYTQLQSLGFSELRNTLIDTFVDEKKYFIDYDYSEFSGGTSSKFPYSGNPVVEKYIKNIRKSGEAFSEIIVKGKQLEAWKKFRRDNGEIEDFRLNGIKALYYYKYSIGPGSIGISTYSPISKEKLNILHRFRNVFNLSHQRYTDIALAEAQAREAQIELGLERVRARAMAMQKSAELSELVDTVFKELTKLDFALTWCMINIIDESSMSNTVWAANPDMNKAPESYHMLFEDYPFHHAMMKGWKERKTKHVYVLEGQEKKVYDEYLFNETEFRRVPAAAQAASRALEKYVVTFTFSNFGGLQTVGDVPLSEANLDILSRFGKVFDLTYTRFNDLKQAEEQAREARIELGLERVRARAMAMQKSGELAELVDTVFIELTKLHIALDRCIIAIIDEKNISATYWMANPELDKTPISYQVPLHELPYMKASFTAWKERKIKWVYDLKGDEKKATVDYIFSKTALSSLPEAAKKGMAATNRIFLNSSFSNFGSLQADTVEPMSDDNLDILYRFAKVFDLTYTRFNDLQKAEAQAREAQIEAALERVRSRTMGMQKSEELKEVIQVVFEQFIHLQIKIGHTGFVIDYKARDDYDIWVADPLGGVPSQVIVPYFDSVYYNRFNEAKEKGENFFATHLSFEEKNSFYKKLFEYIPGLTEEAKEFYFSCPGLAASTVLLENIALYIENFDGIPYTDDENTTLMRFGKVFQQTYTRFLDLQKAEAQAREAKIEAALERTRTQSMLMQHSNELDDTLRVFHQQVLLLGIQSAFSFLWLPDEEKDRHIFWAAWAENDSKDFSTKAIHYPLDRNDPATAQCLVDWKGMQPVVSYRVPPAGVENYFAAWQELIAGVEHLKPEYFSGGLYYVEAFMKYGCFGVLVKNELTEEEKKILYRFAIEFERAYTRFLDLQKAEEQAEIARLNLIQIQEAKQKAEEALMELQATQKQLIQSEKMASLGELTAGIAHEIQNPLNFVNNFSEVSKELLEEMKDALEKGNVEDAKEIMRDVIQNLEKINHHGKRADGIVKGMLQHSRSSSGQKELTDINALCDEYLRLAYHGLRAKDKSFNAKFEADLDVSIGKINLLPQDMGRVVLNLINNAFYAVSERKKANEPGYEPTVTLGTLKKGNTVEIKVTDNGTGIPQKVLDKIFQPFFTTKPTGQGTGLGLSLSYDIVTKAHRGELTVETNEGEGTTFTIILPV